MKLEEVLKVLELHNDWRKGANIEMQKPADITEALDIAVNLLKGLSKKTEIKKIKKQFMSQAIQTINSEFLK